MAVLDLALDPDTMAPFVVDGDLALIEEQIDQTAQALRLELKLVAGEWFLDTTRGVDYFETVFVKGTQQARVESEFRDRILSVDGVRSLKTFQADFDPATRRFRLRFSVDSIAGVIPIEIQAPPVIVDEEEPPAPP